MNMGMILKNDYLVNTIQSIKINDYYFFLMENMELSNLKSFNESELNKCSELLCSYFIYQCLLGLHHMHSKLIVHRDIKLENILINNNYEIKLADFSMSTQLKENVKYPISRSGTIPYLPPESFYTWSKSKSSSQNNNNTKMKSITDFLNSNNSNGNTHNHKKYLSVESSLKKDIFALGIVMYRLLFKEHPFNYEYKMNRETYGQKINNSTLNFKGKEVTSDCISFLEGLLKHNVHKRFNIDDALNHSWIIKTQKIINSLIKKNAGKSKFNLILILNNYIYKEDKEPFKNNDIILDYSTKDSEDKDKDKEKTFLKLKRRRYDENDNDYKNISYIQK
jgi:serine/threonine protein kinase